MNMLMPTTPREARTSLLALGTGAVVAQVVLLREVFATFAGSEITAAVALGLWLICTGAGSLLGGHLDRPQNRLIRAASPRLWRLSAAHFALAFLPFAMLAVMRALPLLAGVRGSALGLPAALAGSLVVFLPYGLLSGGMVPVLGRLASTRPPSATVLGDESDARWAYALDSAGSAGGGLLLGMALASGLSHGLSLALAGLPHVVMGARYGSAAPVTRYEPGAGPQPSGRSSRLAGPAAALLIAALISIGLWADRATIAWRYPGQQVLLVRDTPFGQLAVTRTGAQRNLLQDAIPLTSTGDLSAELRVHPPLCQVPEGARVLLLGGSISGSLRVAMLHRPAGVDCVETDATIFRLGRTSGAAEPAPFPEPALDSPGVRTFSEDGRAFLRRHRGTYDAILLHLPGPENAQLNRFYTEEFFREAHAALRPAGVVSFLLPSSPNYLGAEQLALERSITAALSRSFPEITILPGESHLYLAGDRPANLDLEPVLAARGIVTQRFLDFDWAELSDPFRRDELQQLLLRSNQSPANRDLAPAAFRHFLDLRARLDAGGTRLVQWLVALSILLALLSCLPGRREPAGWAAPAVTAPVGSPPANGPRAAVLFAVATSGFAAMALELAVLLIFQVIFGNLYLRLSLLIALFLGGASIGALLAPRTPGTARTQLRLADAAVALIALAILAASRWGTGDLGPVNLGPENREAVRWIAAHLLLPALALLAAVPMGVQFAAAGRILRGVRSPLGRLYLADLAGAASGTMVTSLWLLPRTGITGVIAAVVAVKVASLAVQHGRVPAGPAALHAKRLE